MTADRGTELDAAIEALGLIALKGKGTSDQRFRLRRDGSLIGMVAGDGFLVAVFVASDPPLRRPGRFRADSSSCHQLPSDQKQVAEREQGEELGAVFGQAAVAGLHMAELALENAERMLDLCPDHRDDAVGPFVEGMQLTAFRGLAHDTPSLARPRARR